MKKKIVYCVLGILAMSFIIYNSINERKPVHQEQETVKEVEKSAEETKQQTTNKEETVKVNNNNLVAISVKFPDPQFQAYLRDTYGEVTTDCLTDTILDISGYKVKDFTGISMYKNLEVLICRNKGNTVLKDLDLQCCKKLRKIVLDGYEINDDTYLDLQIESLRELSLSKCKVNEIPETKNVRNLTIDGNALQSVRIDNDKLTTLTIDGGLNSIEIANAPNLQELNITNTNITKLDLFGCPRLIRLSCANNKLSTLEIPETTLLTRINCSSNNISKLNLSGCTKLRYLDCSNNNMEALTLTGCSNIAALKCTENRLVGIILPEIEIEKHKELWNNIKCDRGVMMMFKDTIKTAE